MITLNDIADAAGVSKSAVSFALNNKGRLEEKTRQRIIKTAQEMGYRPNMLVSGIQTGRTKTIGVVLNSATSFQASTAKGIADALLDYDNVPLIMYKKEGITTEDLLYKLIDRRIDGLIFRPESKSSEYENLDEILKRNIPTVIIESEVRRHPELDFVGVDDFAGGRKAAEYLLGHGHRRLGFLGNSTMKTSNERCRGFERVVAANMDASTVTIETESAEAYKKSAIKILKASNRPTAIFAYSDNFAYQAYLAAQELGLSVPADISIIGFADLEFGKFLIPGLTTFNQHPEEVGKAAAKLLLERIAGKTRDKKTKRIQFEPELVERGSVCNINKKGEAIK